MEYVWCVIAALGAGIGTGLAGLSAATVMVPVLLVLCPSFSGETGAYQATAIALASDILGSAVTACTYAKHKNIDLKRGWIMFVCILAMCTVGSYVAFIVGNVVLGNFTLFLTFCIGIRFLVKPDTSRTESAARGEKFTAKDIAVSLFFGLTIGFGTGFVGTGGGMMMLVVFTVFLGMDLKTAVGTSTFIMTFTALIASASHILIHPAIVLEKWDLMLICIVIATFASLISARFANRVNNRTTGLATGAVLTILGASMLFLYYRDFLLQSELISEIFHCIGVLIVYIVPCLLILLPVRFLTGIPSYIFRKLLHIVAFSCVTLMILSARSWPAAALTSIVIAIVVYPLLSLIESTPWYGKLFVQKSPGEIKRSLLMLFFMFAALIAVAWGIFQRPYLAAAAILMWGPGDAAAALVGIPFGEHKVQLPHTDGKKSWEGSAAMFIVSFFSGLAVLLLAQKMFLPKAMLSSFLGALAGTVTELFSPSEYDTVTVPVVIIIVLLLLSIL